MAANSFVVRWVGANRRRRRRHNCNNRFGDNCDSRFGDIGAEFGRRQHTSNNRTEHLSHGGIVIHRLHVALDGLPAGSRFATAESRLTVVRRHGCTLRHLCTLLRNVATTAHCTVFLEHSAFHVDCTPVTHGSHGGTHEADLLHHNDKAI